MKWETVKIESENVGRKNMFATVGRGQIVFNTTSTRQIPNINDITCVEIMTSNVGSTKFIGFSFKKDFGENCLQVKKRIGKNEEIASVTVSSKPLMGKLFGEIGTKAGATQLQVIIDKGPNEETLLVIKLEQ